MLKNIDQKYLLMLNSCALVGSFSSVGVFFKAPRKGEWHSAINAGISITLHIVLNSVRMHF